MSEIEKDNEKQETEELKIPELIPLLPVRDVVVYPFMIIPLFVGREMSIKAVDSALAGDRMILLATQHDIGAPAQGIRLSLRVARHTLA